MNIRVTSFFPEFGLRTTKFEKFLSLIFPACGMNFLESEGLRGCYYSATDKIAKIFREKTYSR